ncbi:MAG: type II toxin-antitoxin system HigB family toxin [Desulfovibrio sp.]|nr:type II toxin-antitoxin system HigB family toxin [Desulfovibrio sp.]
MRANCELMDTSAAKPLRARYQFTKTTDTPADIKPAFAMPASFCGRVIFSIAENKECLVVWINDPFRIVYVRCIGTHDPFDNIDPQSV